MNNIKLFFWAILIQVFILNNIQLSGYVNPYYYIIFILSLPSKNSKIKMLLLSFLMGFLIDVFSNSYGIHAFSSVLIAYLRIIWITKISSNSDGEELVEISSLPMNQFLIFSCYFVFIHHFTLFFLERFSFYHFFSVLKMTLSSSIFTIFLLVIHKLCSVKKR